MPTYTTLLLHGAAIISVAALALRDQLKLRAVLLVSIVLNAIYNDLTTPPSYESIFWNGVMFVINLIVVVQIVLDRTHIGLSAEEDELFTAFQMLSPGEFRSIVKLSRWGTARGGEIMTREGETPTELFYVLTGTAVVEKSGRSFSVGPKAFIGESRLSERDGRFGDRNARRGCALHRLAGSRSQQTDPRPANPEACRGAAHQLRHGDESGAHLRQDRRLPLQSREIVAQRCRCAGLVQARLRCRDREGARCLAPHFGGAMTGSRLKQTI